MKQEYLSIEDAKKLANYDKLVAENTTLKSNEILNNQAIKNLKNKYEKEIKEKNKKIKELESKVSAYESKQIDIFGG